MTREPDAGSHAHRREYFHPSAEIAADTGTGAAGLWTQTVNCFCPMGTAGTHASGRSSPGKPEEETRTEGPDHLFNLSPSFGLLAPHPVLHGGDGDLIRCSMVGGDNLIRCSMGGTVPQGTAASSRGLPGGSSTEATCA